MPSLEMQVSSLNVHHVQIANNLTQEDDPNSSPFWKAFE